MIIKRLSGFVYCLILIASVSAGAAEAIYSNVDKVIAVGDLHGDYEQYVRILKANKLVDKKLKWAGKDVHFVQLGDITDRGPDSLKIIRHLMKLEKQARKAGGKVHVLIGNHEAMNVQTDLRYVHAGEFGALITKRSGKTQGRYIDAVFKSMMSSQPELIDAEAETRTKLVSRFPLGYVEHRMLWEPGRELARWYAGHNAVIQINDTIYLHGGLDPHVEQYPSLDEINAAVSAELDAKGAPKVTINPRGPLWYRGLANNAAEVELEPLKKMLAHYGAGRIIVAHTPTRGAVLPRFDRRVILADVGISAHYGGSLANVISTGNTIYSLHRGELVELPLDEGLDEYFEKVVALEPEGSPLLNYVKSQQLIPL